MRFLLNASRLIFAGLVLAIIVAATCGTPDRKDDAPKKPAMPPPMPNIAMPSNWGDVVQDAGGNVSITGHDRWRAEGKLVRKDKGWHLELLWTQHLDGRTGPGVYDVGADGRLVGKWNWAAEAVRDGLTQPDVIFRVISDADQ